MVELALSMGIVNSYIHLPEGVTGDKWRFIVAYITQSWVNMRLMMVVSLVIQWDYMFF